jgi:hypothetical protein
MNRSTLKSQTLRDHLPTLTLILSMAIIFVVRCCIAASHLDMGCDIATYLATTNAFFGQDPTGFGLDRPPLIAIPVKLFTLIFGDLNGVRLLGILLSVVICIPFYLLAKRVCHRWVAVGMTMVFILTPAYSDMLTWGYITMAGILFGLLTLYFLIRLLDRPSKANVFLAGFSASLIVGFHQLSLAFFAPLFVLLAAALFIFNRQAFLKNVGALFAAAAVGLILSMPYVPLYLRMVGMQAASGPETTFSVTPSLVPWILGVCLSLPLVALALRWIWQREKNTAVIVAVLLIYSLVLILFMFPPPFVELNRRAHYFMYPAVWLIVGLLLSRIQAWQVAHASTLLRWLPKAGTVAMLVVLLSSTATLSFVTLHRALEFYSYLDDTRWDAMRWIGNEAPHDTSIAAYPEALGWWIEAKARRNTATVTDRDTVPYVFLSERSLAAERVLSRNQGLENGNLRLATTYPYGGAPGQPVIGVCVAGYYRDVIMFDDNRTSVSTEGSSSVSLANASGMEFSVSGDGDSMTMMTVYRMEGVTIVQEATLDRASQTALITYKLDRDSATPTRLDIPVLFGFAAESASVASDQQSIEVVQFLRKRADRVRTEIGIEATGAALQSTSTGEDGVDLSFTIQGEKATIAFTFLVTDPSLDGSGDVIHYEVPNIIQASGLEHLPSLDYLAIDLKPNPHLASALPWGTEQWLNACPYYRLIYSEGDIRVYEVDTSALP